MHHVSSWLDFISVIQKQIHSQVKNNAGNMAAMNRNTKMGGGMMNYNVGGKAKAGSQPMYSEVMPKSFEQSKFLSPVKKVTFELGSSLFILQAHMAFVYSKFSVFFSSVV